jgi:hypothetical protein
MHYVLHNLPNKPQRTLSNSEIHLYVVKSWPYCEQLGAGFSGRSRWRVWVAAESRSEERRGWAKGLRSLVVVSAGGRAGRATVAAVATVVVLRTLSVASEYGLGRPHGGCADCLRRARCCWCCSAGWEGWEGRVGRTTSRQGDG